MRVSATAKYLRGSTRKVRLVTGRHQGQAASRRPPPMLRFMPQAAARDVAKVLKSAAANAENNHNLSADDLPCRRASRTKGRRSSAGGRAPRVGRSRSTSR